MDEPRMPGSILETEASPGTEVAPTRLSLVVGPGCRVDVATLAQVVHFSCTESTEHVAYEKGKQGWIRVVGGEETGYRRNIFLRVIVDSVIVSGRTRCN